MYFRSLQHYSLSWLWEQNREERERRKDGRKMDFCQLPLPSPLASEEWPSAIYRSLSASLHLFPSIFHPFLVLPNRPQLNFNLTMSLMKCTAQNFTDSLDCLEFFTSRFFLWSSKLFYIYSFFFLNCSHAQICRVRQRSFRDFLTMEKSNLSL